MNNKIEIRASVGVSGLFPKIEVLRADGSVKQSLDSFPNLITNAGLERLATSASSPFGTYCRVGTGSTPPSETDTALENQIASTTSYSLSRGVTVGEGFCWGRAVYTFALGAVVGNISELGIGWTASSNNTLFSRALILDQFGNPTTITLLADEQLRVTWENRWYWPTEDSTGVLTNEGNLGGDYSWVARPARVGNWRGGIGGGALDGSSGGGGVTNAYGYYAPSELGAIDEYPSGQSFLSGLSASTFTVDSRTSGVRYSFSIAQGNSADGIQTFNIFGGAGASTVAGRLVFQVRFDPPFLKTANDILQVEFSLSWGRVDAP